MWFLLPLPAPGNAGKFNIQTGLYWCTSVYSCLHEEAHKMDKAAGWISQTQDFKNALELYVIVEFQLPKTDPRAYKIIRMLINQPIVETYANIYALYDGNPPEILKEYYKLIPPPKCKTIKETTICW